MPIFLADAEATEGLGESLARPLARASHAGPFVLHLEGPLGAGKTTLVRGLLRALGYSGRVRSPTFTLLEPYELAQATVAHLDLYRLAHPDELEDLGLTDLLAPGHLLLVEWAARGGDRLPGADLHLALDYDGEGRVAISTALTPAGEAVLGSSGPGRTAVSPG